MSKLDRIPLWLRKQRLIPGTQAPGGSTPTQHDIEVFCAAISGVEARDLKTRFDLPLSEITVSIRTVRDAVKRGDYPEVVLKDHGWIVPLISGVTETRISKRQAEPLAPSGHEQAIARITDQPYEALDREVPGALPKFLHEAKTRFAEATAPLALRRLAESVVKGHPRAVTETREFLWGKVNSAPTVAIQQNFGGQAGSPDQARSTPAFQYEKVILDYEAAHPDAAGEVTQFNESLLEGQETESE